MFGKDDLAIVTQLIFELFFEQQTQNRAIQEKLKGIERIEGDLIDITAALAKFELIDYDSDNNEWKIKRKSAQFGQNS